MSHYPQSRDRSARSFGVGDALSLLGFVEPRDATEVADSNDEAHAETDRDSRPAGFADACE
jgi:hypothetical protein